MAKKLPDRITNCEECPFLRRRAPGSFDSFFREYFCGRSDDALIPRSNVEGGIVSSGPLRGNKIRASIPDWCQLEDAE